MQCNFRLLISNVSFYDLQKVQNKGDDSGAYNAGSTGTVVLLVNGKVLVGYVGDSKAVLCSHGTHDAKGLLCYLYCLQTFLFSDRMTPMSYLFF